MEYYKYMELIKQQKRFFVVGWRTASPRGSDTCGKMGQTFVL